ncbi:hypothetical protein VOLCADRAFT_90312 [Volvox carteri f. nagariensis]|uniref:BSD domain-containing protein n=1 Tax=Volvox carteri f. nagariensis TaxID=3068 RepID=D8TU17_VOLCA|nr:uncharacterized protein VOLCADRAFT_90312 [Volvox carteri f. nagariensis]EFJ49065.1 hypothetical protein VOLCADRAFT_90312 [Volvox carteri f. nagariensis]|eukprot:XP_002949962.1 hypothetical protein VOLCADRAFT_90312 [Volvox carteri f. nagariensis]
MGRNDLPPPHSALPRTFGSELPELHCKGAGGRAVVASSHWTPPPVGASDLDVYHHRSFTRLWFVFPPPTHPRQLCHPAPTFTYSLPFPPSHSSGTTPENETDNQRAKDKPLVRITVATSSPQQAQGPAQHHYVFQFESVADRDAALDVLTKVIAALAGGGAGGTANGGGAAAAAGTGGGGGGAPGENPAVAGGFSRQQRQQMLARDGDLRALWEELVGGGVLSEGDFWGGVASRLAASQPPSAAAWGTSASGVAPAGSGAMVGRRRVGLSNILQRVEAEVDGRHQRVLRVAQIFAEQPAVLRAYRDHVPHRMSEEDFWRRYVRHEMHKESKRKARAEGLNPAAAAASVVDDAGGDIFREAAVAVAAEAAARPGAASAHRQRVDPSLDLTASEGEKYQGFGLAHAATREPELDSERLRVASIHPDALLGGGLEEPDDLAAAINRHGEVVLQVSRHLPGWRPSCGGNHRHLQPPPPPSPPPLPDSGTRQQRRQRQGPQGRGGDGAADDGVQQPQRRRRHSAGLYDLHEPPRPQLDSLSIADPRRYFERVKDAFGAGDDGGGGGGGGGGGLGPGPLRGPHGPGGLKGVATVLSYVSPGALPLVPLDPAAAEGALLEATPLARAMAEDEAAVLVMAPISSESKEILDATRTGTTQVVGGAVPAVPPCPDPAGTLAFLRRTVLAANEACRHFWRNLPANTPARRDKAGRLAKLLEVKRSEVEALNDRARGVEGRFIRQLLKPPMEMLLAALVRSPRQCGQLSFPGEWGQLSSQPLMVLVLLDCAGWAPGIKKPQGAEATQDEPGIIAIKLPSPSQLWATGDNAVWTAVRRQYSNAVAAVGSSGKSHKAAYPSLDRWYLLELSPCLQPPQPPPGSGGREGGGSTLHTGCEGVTRHITRQQLEKLVEWKLARGQWRPRLLSYAREQPEGAVEAASAKALATMRDYLPPHAAADAATSAAASATTAKQHCDTALRTAVEALTALKGVGPATASALLSAACPYVPYMGDEALATCLPAGRQSDYSIKASASEARNEVREAPWSPM